MSNKKNIFYLKVNAETEYSIFCIRHWVNVATLLNAQIIFICDKHNLKKQIIKNINFKSVKYEFIQSEKRKLKKYIKNFTTTKWENAGYAHLTTFFHAKKHCINEFWNIDADDTFICTLPERICKILEEVKNEAEKNNIELFSLDMWRSRTEGKAWTYGITYIRNLEKIIKIFEQENNLNWQKNYIGLDNGLNIDWFTTYLLDNKKLNIQTFYLENVYFIHFGANASFLLNMLGCSLCYWADGKLYFPIILNIIKDKTLGELKIFEDCRKINYELNIHNSIKFLHWINLNWLPKTLKSLWGVNNNVCKEIDVLYNNWLKENNQMAKTIATVERERERESN